MTESVHLGRSWAGHDIEDSCRCKQAPCGLVISSQRHPECRQHTNNRSIHQQHLESDCPAVCSGEETVPNRCGCSCLGCQHHCSAHQGQST